MEILCADLLRSIVERVSDDRDRKSCSEVCKLWYTTEALTRVRVRVRVRHPEHIPNFSQRFTNLTTLEIDAMISDETLVLVSTSFPKLQTLNLAVDIRRVHDPFAVDFGDEGLTAVAEGCRDLREVLLSHRRNVRDGSIVAFRNNARSLTALDLTNCGLITDASLEAAAGMGSLSRLSIRGCNQVTDRGLDFLSSGPASRSLRALDVSFCKQITDIGVRGLKRASCLEELMLWGCGCQGLTDVSGLAVASISSLRKLDLCMQNRITNATLFALANNCRGLVEIGLCNCLVRTKLKGMLFLASRLPLESIHISQAYCDQFTSLYLMKIKEQCPSLRLLNVDYRIKKRFSPSELETLSGVCKLVWVTTYMRYGLLI